MEEFIQIIIFVGAMVIAVIGQNAKNKKKQESASPQETLEDMFPEIEFQGNEEFVSQPIQKPISNPKKVSKKKHTLPQENIPIAPTPAPEKEKKIRINNRKEARRAFIYSEIFNRKY